MIERLKLSELSDAHFCAIAGEEKFLRSKNYRSLLVETWQSGDSSKTINIVQVASAEARMKLKFMYAEDCSGVAPSMIERVLKRFQFGLGDIRPRAPYLVVDHDEIGMTAAKLVRWMKQNLQSDALIIEGKHTSRVSFESENDFMLTRLRFV
jgi:hypothetical protein